MKQAASWYIVKQPNGTCEIIPEEQFDPNTSQRRWGPFPSQGEAIARRVGLIRTGKCQPN